MANHYLYTTHLTRPGAFGNLTLDKQKIVGDHFDYLKNHLEAGRLIMAGPCLDGAFGIVIITAESEEDAQTFMENDPAISNGVMRGELHPFRISLLAT